MELEPIPTTILACAGQTVSQSGLNGQTHRLSQPSFIHTRKAPPTPKKKEKGRKNYKTSISQCLRDEPFFEKKPERGSCQISSGKISRF